MMTNFNVNGAIHTSLIGQVFFQRGEKSPDIRGLWVQGQDVHIQIYHTNGPTKNCLFHAHSGHTCDKLFPDNEISCESILVPFLI